MRGVELEGQDRLTDLARLAEAAPSALERLAALRELASAVAAETLTAVDAAREDGESWSRIGDALGVSKQAARQRFTRRETVAPDRRREARRAADRPPSGRGLSRVAWRSLASMARAALGLTGRRIWRWICRTWTGAFGTTSDDGAG